MTMKFRFHDLNGNIFKKSPKAIRRAEKNIGLIDVGTFPAAIILINEVTISSFRSFSGDSSTLRNMSFKCCGVKPSIPPVEPAGKDFKHSSTSVGRKE